MPDTGPPPDAATAATRVMDADDASAFGRDVARLPLLVGMFGAMVWHARRRARALRLARESAAASRATLERQERFLHDASHELRTPLAIARGHLELLQRDVDARPAHELVVALDELTRMEAIVARLLLLAAASQPAFLRPVRVDVEAFLEDVFMRWSELGAHAWRLGTLPAGTVVCDPERLRAALDALLENAVKYSAPGAVIELTARPTSDGGLAIDVRDEGCGVPAEALGRIFERFGRADAARSRSAGGTGLGLAIADAVAKAHGGRCAVSSTRAGSCFSLIVPGWAPSAQPLDTEPVSA